MNEIKIIVEALIELGERTLDPELLVKLYMIRDDMNSPQEERNFQRKGLKEYPKKKNWGKL